MDEYDDLLARVRSGSTVPVAPALPAAPKMDEFDSLLKQVRTPDLVPAQTAAYSGSFSNPAMEAEKHNLAANIKKMLGEDIAPSIVDPIEDRRRIRQAEMDHGINQSASLRKWIEDDPGNAGLVGKKDIGSLLTVDGALTAGRRLIGNVAAGLFADPASAAYTTAAMPFKLGEQAAGAVLPDWMAQSEMAKALLWAARASKTTGDVAAGARGDEGNIEAGIYSGFRSLGGNLGTMLTGGVLGWGAKATTALMSAVQGGQSALKALDQGKSATAALNYGLADTAAEYATEFPGMKALLSTPGIKQGFMAFAKKAAEFGVKEMGGEQLATVWQDFNEWAFLNPEKTLDDYLAARPDAAIQTAVATLVGGGGQIAVQQAMARGRQVETRALFDALHEGAQNSDLLKAVPEKYREFVKKATADGGIDTVFVPSEQFTTYFQGRDMDPVQVAKELGASNYTEAMAVGSDVMIPMDAFASMIAGTDHYAGLADDLRLHQGDMTARELALAEANKDASLEKMQADIERIAAGNDTSLNAQIKKITDDVALQLGGRYDQKTSETMSQVMRGIAVLTARDIQGKAQAEGRTASEAEIQQGIAAQLAKYDIRINPNPLLPEILTKRPNFKAEIDPLLDMIRAGKGPSEQDIFGKSLVDFIRERGGLAPVGELADVEKIGTPAFQKKLIQDAGKRLDEMAMAAVEAGYFPGTENDQLTETQLVEAILNELGGGQKTFATQDDQALSQRETLESLSKALDQYGLDPATMDNEAIKAALFAEPTYEQGGDEIRIGYRSGGNRKGMEPRFGNTEGNGVYIAAEEESAAFFSEDGKVDQIKYRAPKKPLIVNEEPLPLLNEEFPLYDKIKKSDSEWIRINKIAALQATTLHGITEENYDATIIGNELTKLMIGRGYDAVDVTSGGEKWIVLLDDSLLDLSPKVGAGATATNPSILYQPAYHGSPYKFDRFTLDHIGKGEGAQAYGWGLYFAGKKEIAEYYRDALADNANGPPQRFFKGQPLEPGSPEYHAATLMARSGQTVPRAIKEVSGWIADAETWSDQRKSQASEQSLLAGWKRTLEVLNEATSKKDFTEKPYQGQLYEVEIPEDGEYLLWDRPLSEQPEKVRKAIRSLTPEAKRIEDMSREDLASLLQYVDPNGSWTDENVASEGEDPLTRDDLLQAAQDMDVSEYLSAPISDNQTGESIYKLLASKSGGGEAWTGAGQEAASKALRDVGIAGIKYLDGTSRDKGEGSFNYVIFDENAVKVLQTFYQGEGNRAQIRIGADRKINIDLLKDANFSSFLHEVGHFYLEFIGDLAENGSQQTKDDYAAILKWMGVTSRDQIKVEHHEMFARANERYLMEGKAPSKELRSAFARFKAWMKMLYRDVLNLRVSLSDEVREVFDRIYATDAEIAAARAENDFIDTFATAEQMGVSQAEFEAYKKQAAGEIQEGADQLQAKIMRVQKLKREAWWREELGRVKAEVTAEVDALKDYQTFDALSEKGAELKLDRGDLIQRFGAPILKRLPRGYGEGRGAIYTAADERGVSVGTAAQLMGYDSADAMIEALANLRPRNKLIAAEADARMNSRYGDVLNSVELADEAQESLHNEDRGRKLAMELRSLRALKRSVDPIVKAREKEQAAAEHAGRAQAADVAPLSVFTEAARRVMATKLIRDIRPNDYLIAERKANRKAFESLGKKDYDSAQDFKQQELLNFAMYREAMRVKDEMKKLHDQAAQFEKPAKRQKLGKAGEQYLEAADAILEDVELKTKSLKAIDRTKLMKWLREVENSDLYVTEDMIAGTFAKNWKDLTVEEMRAISDALRNIDHVASRQLKIMSGQRALDLAEWAERASESIRKNGGKPKAATMEDEGRFAKFFHTFNAQNRKLSSLARQMDGGVESGPMFEGLILGMNERGAWEADENAKATKALIELYRPILAMKGGTDGDVRYIPELKTSLSRGGRLAMALNWGNEGNRQRLQSSDYGNGILTQVQINAVFSTLTRQEAEFVNGAWKFIDSYWPQISAKEKRVYGVAPEKVEALPFSMTLADGTTIAMTGGYYPIKYDSTKDDRAAAHDQSQLADEVMRGAFTAQTTRKGHTEARVAEVKRPVRLSLNVITEHVAQVTHDLAYHEWLIDATKIMRNKEVASAIREHYGDPVLKTMRDALTGIAVGDLANQTAVDAALLHLRANVQRSTMGFSLTTAFLQPFGLTQSMARIGVKPVLSGIAHWAGDVAHFENSLKKIREKSVFMQGRGETFNRELHEIKGRVTGQQSKARQIYDASLFMMMQKMQMVADVPAWLGAYNQAVENGTIESEAVALADRAVIESQGGGQTKDLSEFQRKHPMLNIFFSYFSVTYNLMAESTAKTQFTKPTAVAGWLSDMMLLAVIPALGPAVLLSLLRGEGDDDDWMKKLAKWQAAYLFGTVPLLREFSGTFEGYGYAGPPAARIISDTQKFASQMIKVWNNEGEIDEAGTLAFVRFLGTALGVPTTQAVRSYKGWKAWEEGSAPATSILVGPPRND